MSQLRSNARWLAAAQVAKIVLQLVSMTVLARILEPKYYGIMAMANMVLALAGLFRDLGTGAAIVQYRELSERLKTSVFWMSTSMGLLLCIVLSAASPALSLYFREPDLTWVLVLISLTFPISGCTAIHQSLLERSSNFKVLTFVEVGAQSAGLFAAILAALAGWGVYSLVVQALLISVVSAIWLVKLSPWRPSGGLVLAELKSLLGFSGNLTGFNLINFAARNADTAIIGRMLGSMPLGIYAMAYKLMLFPLQSVTYVSNRALFPELSRHQSDQTKVQELYLGTVRYVSLLTFPIMGGLWVARHEFVDIAFGTRWAGLEQIIAWLAWVGMIQSVVSTTGTVFMAKGRTDILFRLGIFSAITQVTAFIVGSTMGILEVAICYLVANCLNFLPNMHFTLKQIGSSFRELLVVVLPSVVSCALMLLVALASKSAAQGFGINDSLRIICFMVIAGGGAYLGSLFLLFRQSWLVLRSSVSRK